MSETLLSISRSLSADVKTLATISHNVANLNTPGYRGVRSIPQFDASDVRTGLDQRDGGVAQTARELDVALRGAGFFVIERDGQPLLMRGGNFRVDAEGLLATSRGDRVHGDAGPIAVPVGGVRIDAKGEMWQGTQSMGRLRIVDVADAARLRPAGDGAYAYDGEVSTFKGTVMQGSLEQANVDPADETVRLMETTRHAESLQRAISIYDRAMDVGINRLGEN
ncbi:MAG: flagellar hook basal-body protein [Pseudomonadota bacterium]|nr:flagellar hook basal-body protein [Pseudomonadota bacterium]